MELFKAGRYYEAERLLRQDLQEQLEKGTGDPLDDAARHVNLALVLVFQNKLTVAETEARRALGLLEGSRSGEASGIHMRIQAVLGKIDYLSGRYPQAETHLLEALRLSKKTITPPPDVAVLLNDVAMAVAAQGDYPRARSSAEQAVGLLRAAGRTANAEYARVLANLGLILLREKNWRLADVAYREALPLLEQELEPDHPHLGVALSEHASVLRKLGFREEAKSADRRAKSILSGPQTTAMPGRHTADIRALRSETSP
jgi:hypothetical protein